MVASKKRIAVRKDAEKGDSFEVKVRQTAIKIYPLKRGEFQFRYYLGDEEKRVTRAKKAAIILEAERVATDIENGKIHAGEMTAAELQSFAHARKLLAPSDPPIHVIVEQWKSLQNKAPGVPVEELAALWQRTRPRNGETHDPGASRVDRLSTAMLQSLEQSAQAAGSTRNLVGFRHDLPRFCKAFGSRRITEVGMEEIQGWLRGLGVGARRQDNLRAELVTFFHFARDRGHLPEALRTEPEKVPKLSKRGSDVSYYHPAELRRLLAAVDEKWLPFLAVAAFAGVRSSEIGRLSWEDFDWTERRIFLPANKALKVRRKRRVPIEDTLFAWLHPWQGASGKLYPQKKPENAWSKYTQILAQAAGMKWRNNNLRHCYGTYQMALTDNAAQVSVWMGNSAGEVLRTYDDVTTPREAKQWQAILPDDWTQKGVVPFQPHTA